jgi:hypothetical protein
MMFNMKTLPYPLSQVLHDTLVQLKRHTEDEHIANLPYAVCRAYGVILRYHAVLCIASLASSQKKYTELNSKVIKALQNPADGDWLAIAHGIAKELAAEITVMKEIRRILDAKISITIKDEKGNPQNLKRLIHDVLSEAVEYRNKLLHGKPIDEAKEKMVCAALSLVCEELSPLEEYLLVVRQDSKWFEGMGLEVTEIGDDFAVSAEMLNNAFPGEENCAGVIKAADGKIAESIQVSPLLYFVSKDKQNRVKFSDLLFCNRGTVEVAEYIAYALSGKYDAKDVGSDKQFKEFFKKLPCPPVQKEKRIDWNELADFHLERFVGRELLLEEIEKKLALPEQVYHELRALSGMGKSAVMANLWHQYANDSIIPRPEGKGTAPGRTAGGDLWIFHFFMAQDGRDHPLIAIQSLTAQLCDACSMQRGQYMTQEFGEQLNKFAQCLEKAKQKIGEEHKIIICLDALDEGIPASSELNFSSLILGEADEENGIPELAEGVIYLMSYRVDEDGKSRADEGLDKEGIDAGLRARFEMANPLKGLETKDVAVFLEKCAEQKPSKEAIDKCWAASCSSHGKDYGADPFYLRFLGEGIRKDEVNLTRLETIPANLDSFFEKTWMDLSTT